MLPPSLGANVVGSRGGTEFDFLVAVRADEYAGVTYLSLHLVVVEGDGGRCGGALVIEVPLKFHRAVRQTRHLSLNLGGFFIRNGHVRIVGGPIAGDVVVGCYCGKVCYTFAIDVGISSYNCRSRNLMVLDDYLRCLLRTLLVGVMPCKYIVLGVGEVSYLGTRVVFAIGEASISTSELG